MCLLWAFRSSSDFGKRAKSRGCQTPSLFAIMPTRFSRIDIAINYLVFHVGRLMDWSINPCLKQMTANIVISWSFITFFIAFFSPAANVAQTHELSGILDQKHHNFIKGYILLFCLVFSRHKIWFISFVLNRWYVDARWYVDYSLICIIPYRIANLFNPILYNCINY